MPVMVALACVAVLLATAAAAVVVGRTAHANRIVYGVSLAAALVTLAAALAQLLGGQAPAAVTLPLGLPWLGAHLRLDALAAFFLAVANLGTAGASLFALGYGRHEQAPMRVLPFYPAFLAGMNLVVLAADAFTFLFSWEFMSLSSWALVMAHHRERDNAHAGYVYLIMASFGTLALLLAFGLLAGPGGGYAFEAIRAAPPSPDLAALVLVLVLIGAGSKAGLVPLHVWLPLAHPAAPSHVSALMSGVMTKVAVYGFVRIAFDLIGPPAWWWSMLVLALAGLTTVMGVLYALMQHDLKRLLAYHTVENIGIIYIGLGLALAFKAQGMAWAAALAMTAALLHVLNHCVFKSLLFFGAGAVLSATGERDMERLGGLIHRMPQTAFAFLVGCVAISALPPLNGFVSEWLDLPGDPALAAAAVVGAEIRGAGGRRAARALGRARRRLLRQGLRHHLPGAPAHRRGRARARDRPALACRHVRVRRHLPRHRRRARCLHGRAGARRAGDGRRARAGAERARLAHDRADRREPLVLQRPAGVRLHRARGLDRGVCDPPPRFRQAAPRPALGLRIPRP